MNHMQHGDPMQCHARAQGSGGRQCRNYPMLGQTVCRMHGGKSPQALANAEDRLKALVHPAITGLQELINNADSDSVRLSAIRDLLDRTGYKPSEKIESTGDTTIRVEYADVVTPKLTPERSNGHG